MHLKLLSEVVANRKITSDEDVEYQHLDDYDLYSDNDDMSHILAVQAHCDLEQIFNKAGIRQGNKNFTIAATVRDQIIGGVASGFKDDDEAQVFTFDVAVDPDWQGYQDVGKVLIDRAIKLAKMHGCDCVRLFVVNRKLAGYLERKYGFDGNDDYEENGRWVPVSMEKWL